MSTYLDLLIAYPLASGLEPPMTGDAFTAVTRIAVTQDYAIYGQLDPHFAVYRKDGRLDIPEQPHIHPQPLPADVRVFLHGDREIREDAFNEPLTWCTAEQLYALRTPSDGEHSWSHAIMAFIRALPPSTPIVLYWH